MIEWVRKMFKEIMELFTDLLELIDDFGSGVSMLLLQRTPWYEAALFIFTCVKK